MLIPPFLHNYGDAPVSTVAGFKGPVPFFSVFGTGGGATGVTPDVTEWLIRARRRGRR